MGVLIMINSDKITNCFPYLTPTSRLPWGLLKPLLHYRLEKVRSSAQVARCRTMN